MSQIIETALAANLAAWIADQMPETGPDYGEIVVANRDAIRARPCIVVATSDSKPVSPLPSTDRVPIGTSRVNRSASTVWWSRRWRCR